jgi:predicted CopG family antitoxin
MASKTLTIKESTYRKLANWKKPGESFSDLLDREFELKIDTGADLIKFAQLRQGTGLGLRQRKPARRKVAA